MWAKKAIAERNECSETTERNRREARLMLPPECFVFTVEFKVISDCSVVAEKCK